MQISKTLLTLCAVALCAGTVSQATPDSEAQAKAREALRKKLAEVEGQPVSVAPGSNLGATPDQIERSREAVRKKIAELNEKGSGSEAPIFADPTPPAGSPRATPEQIERSRESVRQKIVELNEQAAVEAPPTPKPAVLAPASQPEQPVEVSPPKPPKVRPAPAAAAFDPIPAPPSPLPATKEARLAELLKQYQADALTPEQYHKERAKILAEP